MTYHTNKGADKKMSTKQQKGGDKMVAVSFRLPQPTLDRLKRKIGLIAPSKIYRILVLKYLAGEIKITDDDIQKYN